MDALVDASDNRTPFFFDGAVMSYVAEDKFPTLRVTSGIVLILAIGFVLAMSLVQSKELNDKWQQEQVHKKAEIMRREGFKGSDEELARSADAIKQLNKNEEERTKQRKRILGE